LRAPAADEASAALIFACIDLRHQVVLTHRESPPFFRAVF
jgi:hypothetical protein